MTELAQSRWLPIVLLTASNIFMTFAWYGHLKYKSAPLAIVILASWGIALFEYVLQVPANRWGHASYSATELKIMQEIITLCVFCGFATLYLREKIHWNHLLAFLCVLAAVAFTFIPRERLESHAKARPTTDPAAPPAPAPASLLLPWTDTGRPAAARAAAPRKAAASPPATSCKAR